MDQTQNYRILLQQLKTEDLDKLMASVLREMRRRDSDHVAGDVIHGGQKLRKLRDTGKNS